MKPSPILTPIAPTLRTPRLHMRPPREGDGVAVYQAVLETLDHLRAWPASLPWAMAEPSADASEVFCRDSAAAFIRRTALVYLAFDDAGQLVASTSLHAIDWAVPKFELGFWCRASRHRRGLMAEAAGALVGYAVQGLGARRVVALTDEANAGSRAVCQSVGLSLEAVMRNDRADPRGGLRNTCLYALVP